MKIFIIGDTHFGSSVHLGREDPSTKLNTRLLDFNNTLNYIIDKAKELEVQKLIFTGDFFRYQNPTVDQLNLFAKALKRASELNMSTYLIIGNHDQTQRLQSNSSISIFQTLSIPGVHVIDSIKSYEFTTPSNKSIDFIGMPFRSFQMLGVDNNDDATNIINKKLSLELNKVRKDSYKLIVGHYMVEGVVKGGHELTGNNKEPVLPITMFNNIDFTFMGHVHNPQLLSKDPYIYVIGSMDRIDFGEATENKQIAFLDFSKDTPNVEIINLPVRPLHHIKIDLVNQPTATMADVDKYIYAPIKYIEEKGGLKDSIVRVTISSPPNAISFIKTEEIVDYLKKAEVFSIKGINIIKQSDDSMSLNEGISGTDALNRVLEEIEDKTFKEKVRKRAIEIMEEDK